MKLIKLLVLVLSLSLAMPQPQAHAMSPKLKAFLMVSAYGAVGGALLGFASMAFGSGSRAIAQGASLGLYAGMIFGGYVIMSHSRAQNPQPVYPTEEENFGGYGDDPNAPVDDGYGQPAQRYQQPVFNYQARY